MKKILMITVLLTSVFMVNYSMAAETISVKSNEKPGLSRADMERLEGQWYGLLKIPKTDPFIQVFRFEIKENGEFNAFYDMPDDGTIDIPLSDVELVDGTNSLKFSYGPEKYKGEITGDEIVGEATALDEWVPLTLKKGEYKPDRALSLSKEIRDKLSGEWHGQIKTPDGPCDVAFIFETTADGDFVGFYKESGFPYKPPIKEADYSNNKLTLNIGSSFNIKFKGTLAGDMLTGELVHPGFGNILLPMKKRDDLKN